MARVLVVEDDPQVLKVLSLWLEQDHYETFTAADGPEAIDLANRVRPDAILADIRLPTFDGFAVALRCRESNPSVAVVFITGYPSENGRRATADVGIHAYLEKPVRRGEVMRAVAGALASARQPGPSLGPVRPPLGATPGGAEPPMFEGMIGASPFMRDIFGQLAQIARLDRTVLVLGETGTGKELVAKAIHHLSPRFAKPFTTVNCAALPEPLIESELFGHERGAFTDAKEAKAGKFEQASGGTLLLDEVGELSSRAQAKLLRVIETREVSRLGSNRTVRVDVRLIAATNVALEAATGQTFRRDLYWRLNGLRVTLPPLRERGTDLDLLIDHFLPRISAEMGRADIRLTPDARGVLLAHSFPGNVRELEHVLSQAVVSAHGNIEIADLPGSVRGEAVGLRPSDFVLPTGMTMPEATAAATTLLEAAMIHAALAKHGGHHGKAAQTLGIDRATLFRKLEALRRYGPTPLPWTG